MTATLTASTASGFRAPLMDKETGNRLYDVAGRDVIWSGRDDDNAAILTDTYAMWTGGPGFFDLWDLPRGVYEVKASKVVAGGIGNDETGVPAGQRMIAEHQDKVSGGKLTALRWVGVAYLLKHAGIAKVDRFARVGAAGPDSFAVAPAAEPETIVDIWHSEDGSVEMLTAVRYRPLTLNDSQYGARSAWCDATKGIGPLVVVGHQNKVESLVMPVKVPDNIVRIDRMEVAR